MISIKRAIEACGRHFRAVFFLNPTAREPSWLHAHRQANGDRELMSVSFIGGPLDGWTQTVEVDLNDSSQELVSISVSDTLLQIARGEKPAGPSPITSVAHYRLEKESLRWLYHHVGSDKSQFASALLPHIVEDEQA